MDLTVLSVVYVWCLLNQNLVLIFWFGNMMKAKYFPWGVLVYKLFLNERQYHIAVGYLIGLLYYILKFKLNVLRTPKFIQNFVLPRVRFTRILTGDGRVVGFT